MRDFEIRWKNFRSLADTGWLSIRPITVVIGSNASGKTSLIAPLLLLKQTAESTESSLALKTRGGLFDAGTYRDLIHLHQARRELSLGIRFHYHDPDEVDAKERKPVGEQLPGVAELTFVAAGGGSSPALRRYLIKDVFGRTMLTRTLLESGKYSLGGPLAPERGVDLYRAVQKSPPEHFLFTADAVFRERFRAAARRAEMHKGKAPERRSIELKIEPPIQDYLTTVSLVEMLFYGLLSEIAYIGPLCERPRRLYELSGEIPAAVGTCGESAPEIIFRKGKTDDLGRRVNEWIREFEFGFDLQCEKLTEGVFNVSLRRTKTSPRINLADTGFGLSQILPLIVQGFYASEDSLLIAEQPEIHLNPKLQMVLADLFAAIAARGCHVLVETHSEHLVLRLRRLVAEGSVPASDVALYYTERHRDESRVREVFIEPSGHIPDWPRGFFGESLSESLALAAAQEASKSDA